MAARTEAREERELWMGPDFFVAALLLVCCAFGSCVSDCHVNEAQQERARIERATFWAEHPYAARWLVQHGRGDGR